MVITCTASHFSGGRFGGGRPLNLPSYYMMPGADFSCTPRRADLKKYAIEFLASIATARPTVNKSASPFTPDVGE
jgi:hypothetical protein